MNQSRRDGCEDDRKGLESVYACMQTSLFVALHRQHNGHNPSFENILLDCLHILVLKLDILSRRLLFTAMFVCILSCSNRMSYDFRSLKTGIVVCDFL